jgi:hypothetical protein
MMGTDHNVELLGNQDLFGQMFPKDVRESSFPNSASRVPYCLPTFLGFQA